MKILRVNTYFELPEEFEGSFDEALALFMSTYHSTLPVKPSCDPSFNVSSEAFTTNQYRGFKCVAETGVWHLQNADWKRLDRNPDICHTNGNAWVK